MAAARRAGDALIDTLAQSYSVYLHWLSVLHLRSAVEAKRADEMARKYRHWEPPRIEEAAALAQAAGMVDRFNRLFLRTLRSLRDLHRYGPVVVNNPAQVNIGHQQVNTVQPPDPAAGHAPLPPSDDEIRPSRRKARRTSRGPGGG